MIRYLISISPLFGLHKTTRTIINQRSTRLSSMRFKASIIPPGYPPNNSSHTRFRYATSMILSGIRLKRRVLVCQRSVRTITYCTNKHPAGTLGANGRMSAIPGNINFISREVRTRDNRSSLAHTLMVIFHLHTFCRNICHSRFPSIRKQFPSHQFRIIAMQIQAYPLTDLEI